MKAGPGVRRPALRATRGFTLVELLLVLVVFSILAALARPIVHRSVINTRAAVVTENLKLVREAVLAYRLQHEAWPPEGSRGQVPPGLQAFLPEGFSFIGPEYVLDYDDWSRMEGGGPEAVLEYFTQDRPVARTVMRMLGSNVWTDGNTKYSWILTPQP